MHVARGSIYFMVPHSYPYSVLHYSNIHICYLFYILEDLDIASYADDSAIYTVNGKKESVISTLETSSLLLFGCFNNNFMKVNSDKSHFKMSCTEETTAIIDSLPIDSTKTEVLLGIT